MSASRSAEGPAPSAAHLVGEWARLLFATLRDAGVRDVWVSPGSRSTPFTWAALYTEGLTLRPVIDERSAAFLALGHARVTGRPSALLCTSGSAAANYFPAVVEASLSHLPLIVLTADRPLEVQQAAAAQTIDQVKLYGDHARAFIDLGLPDATPSALTGLRRLVAQAVAQSLGPLPGPVHLNLRARKPLEPAPAATPAEHALSDTVTALLARPIARHAPVTGLANEAIRATARTLSEAASGAIVVGPLPPHANSLAEPLAELSNLTGFPIFAEASSQVRFALADHPHAFPLYDWLLSAPSIAAQLRPDVLLCIGHTPTSSAFERWAASAPHRIVLASHGYPDALGTADLVASGNLDEALSALVAALKNPPSLSANSTWRANPNHLDTHANPSSPPFLDTRANPSSPPFLDTRANPSSPPFLDTRANPSSPPFLDTHANPSSPPLLDTHANPSSPPFLDWHAKSISRTEEGSALVKLVSVAHDACGRLVDEALAAATGKLSEGGAVRSVIEALPHGSVLVLGNSLPIRDVDAYVTRAARVRVVSQRGANGIDGLVAGAIGSAIGSGSPTLLLIGDVSLLHDLGSLASANLVTTPLVVAVIDNAGGRIFDQLPVQKLYGGKPTAEKLWLTPPGTQLSHAAALFGLDYSAPTTPAEIRAIVAAVLAKPGVALVHVRVEPDSARHMRQQVLASLAETRG